MSAKLLVAVLLAVAVATSLATVAKSRTKTKPLCGLCVNIVHQLDEVLKHGGDVEAAVDKFCKEDVPAFLVDMCEKVVEKNLEDIIEKLKNHEAAEKICTDILLCRPERKA